MTWRGDDLTLAQIAATFSGVHEQSPAVASITYIVHNRKGQAQLCVTELANGVRPATIATTNHQGRCYYARFPMSEKRFRSLGRVWPNKKACLKFCPLLVVRLFASVLLARPSGTRDRARPRECPDWRRSRAVVSVELQVLSRTIECRRCFPREAPWESRRQWPWPSRRP